MADLRDFTGKNRKFTGASGIKTSSDGLGTGDRVNEKGRLRFNDTTDLLEYYNGTDWKAIDAPPVITGFTINDIGGTAVTSGVIDNEASGSSTIEILGSLFDTTGATVSFVGTGENIIPLTTTRNSANKLTVTVLNSDFDLANGPYAIKVTNGSGLSAELAASITADQVAPVFTNAADTTFSMYDSGRSAGISAAALCGATGATAYAVQAGSLPTGLTLNTSTGAISGTANAEASDTTYTFTIRATGDEATADRQFKITVKAPIVTSLTSTGPGTFSVPAGATTATVLLVAGGGSGGQSLGGGGGAGGMLEGTLTVQPGSSINYVVGAGGSGSNRSTYHSGFYGQNTTFGPIPGTGVTATATGGGYGCGHGPRISPQLGDGSPSFQNSPDINTGGTGGSGGGTGSGDGGSPGLLRGGYGTQGPSAGLTGYGNDGGKGGGSNATSNHGGGGGGGAGGVGADESQDGAGHGGDGGIGRVSTITGSPVYYAGGGGGSPYNGGPNPTSPGAGGAGGGTAGVPSSNGVSSNGGTNTGGGTGCGGHPSGGSGVGGPGIIVVRI